MHGSKGWWKVLCDQCGRKRKSTEVQPRWDGFIVCKPEVDPGCWEARHPLDFIKAPKEDTSVPFVRPEPADTYISYTYNCSAMTSVAIPRVIDASRTIFNGYTDGSVIITNGTVSVVCTWTING